MKELILYVHGRDGSPTESEHYKPLFPDCEVLGLDYQSATPRDAGAEIRAAVERLRERYESVTLIANSIGAYFSMCAGLDGLVRRAFFISPIVDLERLILDMLPRAGVTERELEARGVIPTPFGEDLSWEYLCWVRAHPVCWHVPTRILYGGRDELTAHETVRAFADAHGAELTVMQDGEHWFHTDEQMRFLDRWIAALPAEFKTPRLLLRRFRETDYDDLFEFLSQLRDDEFEGYPGLTYENGKEQLNKRLASEEYYAVALLTSGKVIGNIYIGARDYGAKEVGYIINKREQGQGYAFEALSAVVEAAFRAGTHRLYAECDPRNLPSWRLLERLGFRREAHFRQNLYFHKDAAGTPLWKDTFVYAMLPSDAVNNRKEM